MSSLTQQEPGLFKAPGQIMGAVLTWQCPYPPCCPVSLPFTSHHSPSSAHIDSVMGSLTPHRGSLEFLTWWAPWVQDLPYHTPLVTYCPHAAPYHNLPRVLAFPPQLRAAAVFRNLATQKFPWHHERRWWRHQGPWDSLLIKTWRMCVRKFHFC